MEAQLNLTDEKLKKGGHSVTFLFFLTGKRKKKIHYANFLIDLYIISMMFMKKKFNGICNSFLYRNIKKTKIMDEFIVVMENGRGGLINIPPKLAVFVIAKLHIVCGGIRKKIELVNKVTDKNKK